MPNTINPSNSSSPALDIRRDGKGGIWSHLRQKWLVETPEETVRQNFLLVLADEYGYALDQMEEEADLTGRGSGQARADFVIWRSAQDKADHKPPLIIVECKSDNISIKPADYFQGDNYARIVLAPFVITHNSGETRFWRVVKEKMPGHLQEVAAVPRASEAGDDKKIKELSAQLKTFREREFADLLHKCHNIIRNREKKDPADAFDEIAKILFLKAWSERRMREQNLPESIFSVAFLDNQQKMLQIDALQHVFNQAKAFHADDFIFSDKDEINLRPATARDIVRELEVYNLSDTSEDVKGIAFERFLGSTFRGKELAQFFTPRSVVEFMIRMIEPREDDVICDPASGSGGFLIRFFEIVRELILRDSTREFQDTKAAIEADAQMSEQEKAAQVLAAFNAIQSEVDIKAQKRGSRLWNLANRRIYGIDANERMARTSKMNMIMHGDGHGGVHHWDGFLNINGIFPGRFSVILTNPPFGSTVEENDHVRAPILSAQAEADYRAAYGKPYEDALDALRSAAQPKPGGQPMSIAEMFELSRANKSAKTEILFIERCLALLKPGGRLGIVLPEGIFNNPTLDYVREWTEDRAWVRAVVSLPPDTFKSSKASVKTSVLFLEKFTADEQADYDEQLAKRGAEVAARHAPRVDAHIADLENRIAIAKTARETTVRQVLVAELKVFKRDEAARQKAETRRKHKARWAYRVFLYEAQHVGITATGEADFSELLPVELSLGTRGLPPGVEVSCLELYRAFRADEDAFAAQLEAQAQLQVLVDEANEADGVGTDDVAPMEAEALGATEAA